MIIILRLGHRPFRDQRISTHIGLTARALSADKMIYTGQKDGKLEDSIRGVVNSFGGDFEIEHSESLKKTINEHKKNGFKIVHLTVYGLPVQDQISKIKKSNDLLIIVGGEKVQSEVYQLADYNISVTNQPHSEVTALAILLHEYFNGKELENHIKGKMEIIPQERGKKVAKQ